MRSLAAIPGACCFPLSGSRSCSDDCAIRVGLTHVPTRDRVHDRLRVWVSCGGWRDGHQRKGEKGIKGQKMATMAMKGNERRKMLLRWHVTYLAGLFIAFYEPLRFSPNTRILQILDLARNLSVPTDLSWGFQIWSGKSASRTSAGSAGLSSFSEPSKKEGVA